MNNIYEAVANTFTHLTGRDEIIEHYRDTHGTKWKTEIQNDLMRQTGKNKNTVSREFQYDKRTGAERYKNPKQTKATKEKYKELGKKLPPIAAPEEFHITGTIHIQYSEECVEREVDVTISGEDAVTFAANPDIQAVINLYNEQDMDDEEGYKPCNPEGNNFTVVGTGKRWFK